MANVPDITPENRRLQQEYDDLKKIFSDLMLSFEYMRQHEGPKLNAIYLKLLGRRKYEIMRLQVELKALELRKRFLQSYINRDQTPDLEEIKRQVKDAVSEYNRMLEFEAEKLKGAKIFLESPILSKEDSEELKALYRLLVKHLHPDINPELSDEERDMFLVVQTAYANGDLEKLREISLAINTGKLINTVDYTHNISVYIEKLKERIGVLEQRISDLEKMFPFTLRKNLSDKEWVKQERKIDAETISQLTERRDQLAKIVEVMEEYKSQKL